MVIFLVLLEKKFSSFITIAKILLHSFIAAVEHEVNFQAEAETQDSGNNMDLK